jgi:hypothetical protein
MTDSRFAPFTRRAGGLVNVRVPDYGAAKSWYIENLGFRVLQEGCCDVVLFARYCSSDGDAVRVELLTEPVRDHPSVGDEIAAGVTASGHEFVRLGVDDVRATAIRAVSARRRGGGLPCWKSSAPAVPTHLADAWRSVATRGEIDRTRREVEQCQGMTTVAVATGTYSLST